MVEKGLLQCSLVALAGVFLLAGCARGPSKSHLAQGPRIGYICIYHNDLTKAVYRAFHEGLGQAKVAAWSKCRMGRLSKGCSYVACVKTNED